MTRRLEAELVIKGRDSSGRAFQSATNNITRLVAAAKAANTRLATSLSRGAAGSVGAAAARVQSAQSSLMALPGGRALGAGALAMGGAQAVKNFANAEMAITRIGITAGATDEQIATLHKSMRDLAFNTATTFEDVTEGLAAQVSGGVDLDKAVKAMPAIVRTSQAAGAAVVDTANTALALAQNLDISSDKMQAAFDIMVAGGKAGKFELKDMAFHFARIAPIAAAAGFKGEEGLKRIVAMLQAVRNQTGNAESAANGFRDMLARMETEETVNKFERFGINLRKEMESARKNGRDLLETMLELTDKATKGDISKLPQLFQEVDSQSAVRALLSQRNLLREIRGELDKAAGSTEKDFQRVMQRAKTDVDRLSESFKRLSENIGQAAVAAGAVTAMDGLSKEIQRSINGAPPIDLQMAEYKRNIAPKVVAEARARVHRLESNMADIENNRDLPASARAELATELRAKLARAQAALQKAFENQIDAEQAWRRGDTGMPALFGADEVARWQSEMNRERRGHVPTSTNDPRRRPLVPPSLDHDLKTPSVPAEVTIKGPIEISGSKQQVDVSVKVDAGDGFTARVQSIVRDVVGKLWRGGQATPSGTTGATGKSMPEAQGFE